VQVPVVRSTTTVPDAEQTPAVSLVSATGRPELVDDGVRELARLVGPLQHHVGRLREDDRLRLAGAERLRHVRSRRDVTVAGLTGRDGARADIRDDQAGPGHAARPPGGVR
jgi:hypothetical protein